jgi:hypothetical protein
MNIPDHIPKSLETICWVKKNYLITWEPDPESGIFLTLDPESGMEKFGSGIQDNHPGSATLTYFDLFVSEGVPGTDQRLSYGRSDSQRLWHYYQVVCHLYHEGMERIKDKKQTFFCPPANLVFFGKLAWREGGWCYFMILRGDIIFVIFMLI